MLLQISITSFIVIGLCLMTDEASPKVKSVKDPTDITFFCPLFFAIKVIEEVEQNAQLMYKRACDLFRMINFALPRKYLCPQAGQLIIAFILKFIA